MKKQVLSFLHFQFQKILLFFEGKKMRFSLSALQFGKELLEVKSNAEEKQFGRDIGSPSHQEAPEVPQAGRWLHTPVHVHLLKYFRLLAGSAVDICRPFLYTVHVVSGSLQFQFTTKNEIGNPFRGSLSHFFVGAVFIRRCVPVHPSGWPSRSAWCLLHDAVLRRQALHAGGRNSAA